jgi:glycosyltransferase involved in cell wall biosynthesis
MTHRVRSLRLRERRRAPAQSASSRGAVPRSGGAPEVRVKAGRAPVVSIVIAVFDAQRYLGECLDALLGQDYTDFEIVAVDDGSRDGSAALLQQYRARDARVRVTTQVNRGPAAARNAGLAQARGEYLWFADADDVVAAGALGELVAAARAHDAEVVAFNAERFGSGDRAAVYGRPKPAAPMDGETWIRAVIADDEFRHFPWLWFCRRDFLARHGLRFATGLLHEDIGWTTECLLRARRLVYLDRLLYRYRRHPESITGGRDDARLLRRIDSYFSIVDQLRAINARCPMGDATRRSLRAQIVAQGLQVDRLSARLADRAQRARVRARCREARFWQRLWADAADFKGRRQVLKVLLRQGLRLP